MMMIDDDDNDDDNVQCDMSDVICI